MFCSLSDEKSLPFQELSMQIQHFCASLSFWKVSFPPFHFHSIFLLCVGVVFAKDFTSSLSFFPLCYSLSPFIPSTNTELASMACVCGCLTLLSSLCHNYSPIGLSSYLDINYMSKEPVLVICLCSTKQYLC